MPGWKEWVGADIVKWGDGWMGGWMDGWTDSHVRLEINLFFPEPFLAQATVKQAENFLRYPQEERHEEKRKKERKYQCPHPTASFNAESSALEDKLEKNGPALGLEG